MKIQRRKFYISLGKKLYKGATLKAKTYCSNTTLHGFSYIVKENTSYKTIFWCIICISCLILCSLFIYMQLLRYQNNRITTTITTTNYPIWNVPFPAVTICNFNVVYRDHMDPLLKVLSKYKLSDYVIRDYFLNLSSIILNNELLLDEVDWDGYSQITDALREEGYDTETLMEKLAHPCSSMLQRCLWKNEIVNCQDIFQIIKTTAGFCCSFNYKGIDIKHISLGKPDLYASGAGPNFGLEIYLDAETSQYMSSTKPNYGHSVAVHDSHEYPDIWLYSTNLNPGHKISYSIKPVLISSKKEIKNIDVETRSCIFDDEKKLLWTNYYTFNSCLNQCKARVMRRLCGCIPFFYPLRSMRFCNIMDLVCLQDAEKKFSDREISMGENYDLSNRIICHCRYQCNEINYEHNVEHEQLIPTVGFDSNFSNSSIVSVYFSNIGAIQFTRTEYLTWDSLLASIGGIFGLFLGGSIVSIIEFFYHIMTFTNSDKYICNLFKRKFKNKVEKYEAKVYWSELYPKRNHQ